MTSTLVRGRQEGLDHGDGLLVGDEAAGHGKHVGIVVLTSQAGDRQAPTQSRTHTLVLVERDVDALTTATHGDAGIALATLDRGSAGMGKIGVVAAVLVIGTEVLVGNALSVKPLLDGFFGLETGMVAA